MEEGCVKVYDGRFDERKESSKFYGLKYIFFLLVDIQMSIGWVRDIGKCKIFGIKIPIDL